LKTSTLTDIEIIRKKVEHLRKNPNEVRAMVVKAGIYTEDGKLTKAYGGAA